jgi:hypothetical protein
MGQRRRKPMTERLAGVALRPVPAAHFSDAPIAGTMAGWKRIWARARWAPIEAAANWIAGIAARDKPARMTRGEAIAV